MMCVRLLLSVTMLELLLQLAPSSSLVSATSTVNKPSKDSSASPDNVFVPLPFKSKKANLIWQKASKKHEGNVATLKSLEMDLRMLDKELMSLKKAKYENEDPLGDMEGSVEEKIHGLLVKYDIAGKLQQDTISNRVDDHIEDDKMEVLYNRAKAIGFSDDDLKDLKTEIFHHKLKMAELDALVDKHKRLEAHVRVASNAIEKKEGRDEHAGDSRLAELQSAIMEKKQEVGASLSRLHLLADNPELVKGVEFKHPKVLRLWSDILVSKFSEEEKESLKQELAHLEQRLIKRDKLEEEHSMVESHYKTRGNSLANSQHLIDKRDKIKEKYDQLDKHVNKYVKDIDARIYERRHTEL